MTRVLKTIYYLVVLLLFSIVAFGCYLVVWLLALPFDKDKVISHHYSRFWARCIHGISPWWRIKVNGLENIEKGRSYVVIANHQSMLDIPLLYKLPFNFKWVSKQEVFAIPIYGWVLWMHDDIAIKRGGAISAKGMMDKANRMLKRGVSVIIFPEGTRTKTGAVAQFKPGPFIIAKKSKVEILPVVVNGNFEAFKAGGKGRFLISTPHKFTVDILPPVSVESVGNHSFDELSVILHDLIKSYHRTVAPQYYDKESTKE